MTDFEILREGPAIPKPHGYMDLPSKQRRMAQLLRSYYPDTVPWYEFGGNTPVVRMQAKALREKGWPVQTVRNFGLRLESLPDQDERDFS